jgi:hypothetical protein
MRVKLGWYSQFCGRAEEIVEVRDDVKDEEIKALFPAIIGVEYSENECE